MILKYIGDQQYRDQGNRFIAAQGDKIDFKDTEAEELLKTKPKLFVKEVEKSVNSRKNRSSVQD